MGMLKEFKEFAMKGNVIDLAVGVVIGAAFGAIVSAVVDNIIMPIVGMITGGINFDALSVKVGDAELKYGMAISAAVKFIAIALFLFMVIKAINSAKKKEEAAPAAPAPTPEDIQLLREIRDALKK
jgi:large conductance mechanosensitive channel